MYVGVFCLGLTLYNALGVLCEEAEPSAADKKDSDSKDDYNEIQLEPRFGFPPIQLVVVDISDTNQNSSILTTSTTTQDPAVVRANLCKGFGGKIINMTLCYEYIEGRERTYADASAFCSDKGGRLWVPNIYDPNLSFILFQEFPEIYDEIYSLSLWIGIEKQDDSFVSNTGQVFDDNPLLFPWLDYDPFYYYFDDVCVVLYLYGNAFDLYPVDCEFSERNFVCEYDV